MRPISKKYKGTENILGRRFGRLVVVSDEIRREKIGKYTKYYISVICDCGIRKEVGLGPLIRGSTSSCGCLKRDTDKKNLDSIKHGCSKTREYKIWDAMKQRCYSPNFDAYPYYGGRGISICDQWRNSFEAFIFDMGKCPYEKGRIDRVDSNGNYEPSNCRWVATQKEQANNTRGNRFVEYMGQRKTVSQWCDELKIVPGMVALRRMHAGWDQIEAITIPIKGRPPRRPRGPVYKNSKINKNPQPDGRGELLTK